jgi:hypothetical protein
MIRSVLAFALASLALAGCTQAVEDDRVEQRRADLIGGSTVGPETLPGAIFYRFPDGGGYCTGTFVTPRHVLTAAHCVSLFGAAANTTLRYTNQTDAWRSTFSERRIAALHIHPGYHGEGWMPDLAVIELADADFAMPTIPVSAATVYPREMATVLGYGCARFGDRAGDAVRRIASGPVSSSGTTLALQFDDWFQMTTGDDPGGMMAGAHFGLCPGDSGGPLLINGRIAGVSSSVWVRGDQVKVSAFAPVSAGVDWLASLGVPSSY